MVANNSPRGSTGSGSTAAQVTTDDSIPDAAASFVSDVTPAESTDCHDLFPYDGLTSIIITCLELLIRVPSMKENRKTRQKVSWPESHQL